MKTFYLLRKQGGEGCDYTIACGYAFTKLRGTSKEKVIGKLISDSNFSEEENYWEEYLHGGERGLDICLLVEAESVTDLMPLITKFEEDKKKAKLEKEAKKQEESERALYDKLKKKFK